jgi:retinol dehydrogenase 14
MPATMAGISTGPTAGPTALPAGGTGGIGRATATGLAAISARAGITSRDTPRARAAATDTAAAPATPP